MPNRALAITLFVAAQASAQLRLPPVPGECGFRCGLVLVAPGTYMDCGPCPGACGDTICQPGIGENHANCPADCLPGSCVSEGCLGRCGIVRDQCHRQINCGPCPSSCGDGLCDPGEWITCQADCGSQCQPEPACGLRCGIVDDGCGFSLDCGPCGGQCGNGLCESGETNFACPEDCPPPGCVSSGCNGACGAYVDECGRLLSCGTCGSHTQCPHANGVCEPELGEDRLNCKFECPYGCGDGTCGPSDPLRCPADCDGTPPEGITAGGPYAGVVGESVHFFARVAPSVAATSLRWTFGDGASATGLTAQHAYALAGVYEITFEATVGDGSVLRSFTSASIARPAQTSGFDVAFDMSYDAAGDGIVATATIRETPGPPGPPRKPAAAMAIQNPAGQIVHQTGWVPLEAQADPIHVPALANPTPGVWRGQALFAYLDPSTQQLHYLGALYASAVVPSSQCSGCLTLAPVEAIIRDGGSRDFTATPNSSPPPEQLAWSFSKPAGSSSAGFVEFAGGGLSVNATATWFAQPDQECVSSDLLAAQAFENAKYTIKAAGLVGSQLATGQAELQVQMPWGLPAAMGGGGSAAVTAPPELLGDVQWDCASPDPTAPCRVTGDTHIRTLPVACFAETSDARCATPQQQNALMPLGSSFRHKAEVHEARHVHQFEAGQILGDLYRTDGLQGLMSFEVPGTSTALRDFTSTSPAQMDAAIMTTKAAWRLWMNVLLDLRRYVTELAAYAASDPIAPRYLLQGCNVLTP